MKSEMRLMTYLLSFKDAFYTKKNWLRRGGMICNDQSLIFDLIIISQAR